MIIKLADLQGSIDRLHQREAAKVSKLEQEAARLMADGDWGRVGQEYPGKRREFKNRIVKIFKEIEESKLRVTKVKDRLKRSADYHVAKASIAPVPATNVSPVSVAKTNVSPVSVAKTNVSPPTKPSVDPATFKRRRLIAGAIAGTLLAALTIKKFRSRSDHQVSD